MAAKKQTTAVASWDDKLAALGAKTQAVTARFQGGGQFTFISHEGGVLSAGKQPFPQNQGRFTILDSVAHNVFYDPTKPYVRGQTQAPLCYAFGREDGTMAPHPSAPDPQAATCAACPNMVKGSGKTGKNRACSQKVRMALVAENDIPTAVEAEKFCVTIPPTSAFNFTKGLEALALAGARNAKGEAVTQIGVLTVGVTRQTGNNALYALTFTQPAVVDKTHWQGLIEASEGLKDDLMFPYAVASADEASVAAPAGAVSGKTLKGRGKY